MPRGPFPGLPGRLAEVSRWRRLTAALGAIGAVAFAVGIILATGLAGSSKGASPSTKTSGSATVQRRDLVETDTESGTLSYANPQTVFNRLSGTITSLPAIGRVMKPGQTLYKVDGVPVVLFNGTIPAYRDLSEGVTDGLDVQELKQNLVALGFDPSHQITINETYDAATAAAVDNWQSALGETQTGTVTLGQVVFLPGSQRITSVDTVLGSTGGASSASSGSSGSSGSGTATGASTTVAPARPEFVSLTTTPAATTATTTTPTSTTPTTTTPTAPCPSSSGQPSTTTTTTTPAAPNCDQRTGSGSGKPKSPSQLAALLALLKAETLELKKSGSAGASGSRTAGGGSSASAGGGGSGGGGGGGGGGGAASATGASGASASGSGGSGSSGAASAQAILQTTSTRLVVTVDLDATKQTEAVLGEPVTVELPDGSDADGKITAVSPVAQTSSSSSSSSSSASGAGGGGGSSTPSATVPVTITLTGHRHVNGLDQAAVSVNFEQQKANNVLSVPVTALVATAGGGYAVQEAAAPQRLVPVTPGLFAAGYVQISGSGIFPGLQVTDSQG